MKIEKINLTNFRQYYGSNTLDLRVSNNKNIVLIGGKNGYGKTNLLLSLVWCLYGEGISKIDDNFKREIVKDGSYAKFLKSSLNWKSLKEGNRVFSVEIILSDVQIPQDFENSSKGFYKCTIARSFDIEQMDDWLDIHIEGLKQDIFKGNEEKISFINDYIIPIEAAKFVFFDAEKIANWAELSTKEEGSVLNDALSKMLGLDVYESLLRDFDIYMDELRKDSATSQVKAQISSTEKGIVINNEKIDELEAEVVRIDSLITECKNRVFNYDSFLAKHSSSIFNPSNLIDLKKKRNQLQERVTMLQGRFHEFSDFIPFVLLHGVHREVISHIAKQTEVAKYIDKADRIEIIKNDIIEKLFNNPPFPNDGDISFLKKIFYAEKAKRIIDDVLDDPTVSPDLPFEYDLNKSEHDLIFDAFHFVSTQSNETFDQLLSNIESVNLEVSEIDIQIRRIEADSEDEEIVEYSNKKKESERKLEKLIEEKGAVNSKIEAIRKDNERLNQSLHLLLRKVGISEQKRKKFDKANLYTKSLLEFIEIQKKSKCSLLEKSMLNEMGKLMHKLQDSSSTNFIAQVKAETLPDNDGLKISLYDKDGIIRQKESLSQGEKQLYISSLIKALLSLTIQDYPIFIDTPLGRLDDEHIKNILLYYYPDLANQVVLMATNNEIPSFRVKLFKDSISKMYLIESSDNNSSFKTGYF